MFSAPSTYSNACTGPEISKTLRLSDFETICIRKWYDFVSITRRQHLRSFLLETVSIPGPLCGRKNYSNNTIGNRTNDFPDCTVLTQPNAPSGANEITQTANCALLGYYAKISAKFFPTFRDKLSD
jgi:hypothetical protein